MFNLTLRKRSEKYVVRALYFFIFLMLALTLKAGADLCSRMAQMPKMREALQGDPYDEKNLKVRDAGQRNSVRPVDRASETNGPKQVASNAR